MNPILKQILWPLVLLRRSHDDYLKKTNPEKLFCLRYKRVVGKKLNIENPKTLYEKIAYMAFRTDTTLWSRLADKIAVREYIRECGFGDCCPKLLGTWDKAENIDFDSLPNSFVIKTNNASATNIIVSDKRELNIETAKKQLNKWLKWEYGYETCQPHYSRIPPKILAEEFLIDNKTTKEGKMLIDYKFYCLGGVPKYVMIMSDRIPNTHEFSCGVYDMDFNLKPQYTSKLHPYPVNLEKPKSFELMKEIAEKITKGFSFVRIDFYEINGKPYFGELTFTPGLDTFSSEFQEELGKLCVI